MLKKLSGYILALVGLTLLFTSCKKDYESIQSIDSKTIADYISSNNLTNVMIADSAKTGYYYQIVTQGTGRPLKNTDSILYNGVVKGLENGTVYLSTPTYANLGTYVAYTDKLGYNGGTYTISAIHDVMRKLNRGGVARIILPSHLGFGKNGAGSIPSNENLDITITTYADTTQAQHDDNMIQQFVTSKGLTMIKDPSGVYYSISAVGSGTYPITVNSTIFASYTGRYIDGTVFDTNTNISFDFSPGGNLGVKGWSAVIPGKLQRNGKIRMIIPSRLAYGTAGSGTLPGNAILDFDVEVLSVLQ